MSLICERCGTPTDVIRVSPNDVDTCKGEIWNAICKCEGCDKVGKLVVESVGFDLENERESVFAKINCEGLYPIDEGIGFGFSWVAKNEKGAASSPFSLFPTVVDGESVLVGDVDTPWGGKAEAVVTWRFEFLGREWSVA